ncbi:DNA repair protein recA homolog 3, mitochondrial [Linum perenne]
MARLLLRNTLSLKTFLVPDLLKGGLCGTSSRVCNFATKGRRKSKSDGSDSSEDDLSKRDVALQQALDHINSTFGKGSIMWFGRAIAPRNLPVVSTGSLLLDVALGTGGFPKGRVVEIYGPEASGKTTLALHLIAEAQKQGAYCVFVDAEHALDSSLAEAIGVNTENLLLSQPDCGEQALSLVDTIIRSGSVGVVVVDSISTFGGFGGPQEVTCGGNALKFYASVRLNIKRIGLVKKGEETVGSRVQVKVMKNKLAPPFKTVEFDLEFGKGICQASEIIELGLKHKILTKAGSFYTYEDKRFHGKDALKAFINEKEDAREEMKMKIKEKLAAGTDSEPPTEVISSDSTDEEATAVEALS